ncbi:hypothetical protein HMN09_00043200 [Mycena chlorophos]|uniref:Mitochondrial escape protein 2 n=1 Tax=Mycena chlorophos TaxID=658473 RepID=A0A8H6TTT3_MYCCL|nr:hypothetical protein HMN09_00043200 [Mycena chlorophos]
MSSYAFRLRRPLPPLWPLRRRGIRCYSDATTTLPTHRAQLFIDSLPTTANYFEFFTAQSWVRYKQPATIEALRNHLSAVKKHNFAVAEMEPHIKDGGIFVTFEYTAQPGVDSEVALKEIEAEVNDFDKYGALPSLLRGHKPNAWLVKGEPWIEDMWRLSSKFLNVYFDGPDVGEERIYRLMRPYGTIQNIIQPPTFPAGSKRFMTVLFREGRGAATARNVLHGLELQTASGAPPTRLNIQYASQFKDRSQKVGDWITNHPRISLPILLFLAGTISYAIFDPIRYFTVKGTMQGWFVLKEYRIYRWLHAKSVELRILSSPEREDSQDIWKERQQAEKDTRAYLSDWPSTIAFVHGPLGSGKTRMLERVLGDSTRTVLTIDCRKLQDAQSDAKVVGTLAKQLGYVPVFSFVNSISQVADLVSVGLTGQKANLSSSLPEQIRQMLAVVRAAIKSVGASEQREVQRRAKRNADRDAKNDANAANSAEKKAETELQAVSALPVVVIRNFDSRGSNREDVFDELAEWAASLVEQKLAHVIVVTDNRENAKRVAKALPSKPLASIALSDADSASAQAFVKRKLEDMNLTYTHDQIESIKRLGGRASDLENLIHKVRNGATIDAAVEDIISRGVGELRKNAFGDDAEDAKSLPWTREEAWALFKLLAKKSEVPYHDVLLEFPFKGNETALRAMEHAEIISIATHNGRPSAIIPGRPVYRYVFQRLVDDPIFQATQEIAFNEKLITSSESTIKTCEQELLSLKEIAGQESHWLWGGNTATTARSRYLFSKMHAATLKIEALERKNTDLKKVLAKGG